MDFSFKDSNQTEMDIITHAAKHGAEARVYCDVIILTIEMFDKHVRDFIMPSVANTLNDVFKAIEISTHLMYKKIYYS